MIAQVAMNNNPIDDVSSSLLLDVDGHIAVPALPNYCLDAARDRLSGVSMFSMCGVWITRSQHHGSVLCVSSSSSSSNSSSSSSSCKAIDLSKEERARRQASQRGVEEQGPLALDINNGKWQAGQRQCGRGSDESVWRAPADAVALALCSVIPPT